MVGIAYMYIDTIFAFYGGGGGGVGWYFLILFCILIYLLDLLFF